MESNGWSAKFKSLLTWRSLLVLLCRLVVGGTFIFSGFVKGVDLWGFYYKIGDYLTAFGWDWARPFAGLAAGFVPLFEFVLGILLLIGSFRRTAVILGLLTMVFMLPLTFYVWVANPVADCGCFGDALVLSNQTTFWKNVVLTAGLVFLLDNNKRVRSLYGPAVQWMTVVFPAVYLLIIIYWGYYVQPLIDFRPYKIGTEIIASNVDSGEDDFVFIYEKDGVQREFMLDSLPDDSWNFVDRKPIAKPEVQPRAQHVEPIAIYDGDVEVTAEVLPREGDVVLVLIPNISGIDVATTFRLNDMNEYASESGVSLVCLTSGSEDEIAQWKEFAFADYPIFTMDDSMLKTIARGNPAIVRVIDGRIVWKSTLDSIESDELPELFDMSFDNEEVSLADRGRVMLVLTVTFGILGVLLLLINRLGLVIKFSIRMRRNQNKTVNLQKK